MTRKSQEASLQVKVAAEADPELLRKNPEDRDHDPDPKSIWLAQIDAWAPRALCVGFYDIDH